MVLAACMPAHAQSDPAVVGEWSQPKVWPTYPVHGNLLPTGKVLFWSEGDNPMLWDPEGDTFVVVQQAGYDITCAGFAFLGNGHLLVAGGHGHPTEEIGLPHASIYNPFTGLWTQLPDMSTVRWYPSVTTLPNGDLLVTSGKISPQLGPTKLHEVWQVASGSWRALTSAELQIPLYPWMFVAPDGKVFLAGWTKPTRYLDVSGTGSWTFVANSGLVERSFGAAVMYRPGKILIAGGADPPTDSAEVIDLSSPTPAWRAVAPMTTVRRQHNATLLPDGTVLVTGGSSGAGFNDESEPVFQAELWNPVDESWTPLSSNSIYRGYHSFALLLPDGRVLTAGGINNFYKNGETFSPPYLFKGPRPVISTVRASVGYNRQFFVGTPDTAGIARVTWVRLGSATHAWNMNQRFNELSFTQTAGGLTVTTPAGGALAPPGHYLLFLLNGQGVPSLARIVRIDAASGSPPSAPSSLTAAAVTSTQIDLAWTDNAGNEEGHLVERSLDGVVFIEMADLPANSTGYADLGLTPATPYHYRVRAYNFATDSAFSNTASATTPGVPVANLSTEALGFGSVFVKTASSAQTVTLSNPGTGALTIATILISGDFSQMNDCGATLAPGVDCDIQVTFAPTALGLRTGSLSVFDSAAGSPQVVGLTGTGINVRNPLPTVTGLSPPGTLAGGGDDLILAVLGSNFAASSVVRWNDTDLDTTFMSSGLLQAAIPAGDVASPGSANVTVFSPEPGGGTSNTKVFNIQNMSNQPPSTGLLAPDSVAAGTIRDTLTVQVMGSNFVMGSVVRWNGSNRLTTFVSGDRVDATIPASDLLSAGSAQVTVFTPAPGGGTSNPQPFSINNPPPTLAAIFPSSATAGAPGFTLVVTGSNFVPGSIVRWNASNRPTTFIGNSQLRVEIPASDLAMAGNANVTVFTPAPGGEASDSQTFTINPVVVASSPEEDAPPADTIAVEPTQPTREPEGAGGSVLAAVEAGSEPAGTGSAPGTSDVKRQAALVGATMGRTVASEIPVLEALEPETTAAGNGKFILKVRGRNFLPGAVVRWNGKHLRTTFSDREQLLAEIPARLAATPGSVRITVVNPSPANAVSQPLEFAVR